ncbi:MAG: thioredoxin family protein [Candidatus Acidiferrales bacterium]
MRQMRRMSFGVAVAALIAGVWTAWVPGATGRASAFARARAVAQNSDATSSFASLDAWKAAVLSGDMDTLRAMYSTDPPAMQTTPKGKSQDPAAEAEFWTSVKAAGLERMETKIVRRESPQSGVQLVMFTLEATLRGKNGIERRFASMAQYWMEQNGKQVIVATQRTNLATMPQPFESNPSLYPDPTEARTDIGLALAAAKRDRKRVLLDFGGNWCYDCHVLDTAFHYPEIEKILEPNYVVVHINIGQYDKNLDLAEKYQIPLKRGVPSLAVLDSSGALLVSQKQGDFENTTKIGPKDVEEFLEKWKP